jgi:CubicO group peptidase (beta-lactamase class C family)
VTPRHAASSRSTRNDRIGAGRVAADGRGRLRGLLSCCAGLVLSACAATAPAPATMPGARALDAYLDQAVAPGGYPGVVALVANKDAVLYQRAAGHRDLGRQDPLRTDAIFRIYSMTKPIVSVAALMLVDEDRIRLDDPVAAYLPAFGGLKVMDPDGAQRPPERTLTIRHLLTHTSGLSVGHGATASLREQAFPEGAGDLAGYTARLSRVPLAHDPGTVFAYDGTATQVLSRVIEVVSGESLGEHLQRRLFAPLGMRDTGFVVPGAQRHRVVDLVTLDDDGRLRIADGSSAAQPGTRLNAYDSGAGGLYSTAADYLRFCRMLLSGGTLDGQRYLGAEHVHAMLQSQLHHLPQPHMPSTGHQGFGFGVSILLDPAAGGRLGAPGQAGWSGAASTYFSIDPARGMVSILLAQYLPRDVPGDLPRLSTRFYNLVQQDLRP